MSSDQRFAPYILVIGEDEHLAHFQYDESDVSAVLTTPFHRAWDGIYLDHMSFKSIDGRFMQRVAVTASDLALAGSGSIYVEVGSLVVPTLDDPTPDQPALDELRARFPGLTFEVGAAEIVYHADAAGGRATAFR